jgi:hypothetical protein
MSEIGKWGLTEQDKDVWRLVLKAALKRLEK